MLTILANKKSFLANKLLFSANKMAKTANKIFYFSTMSNHHKQHLHELIANIDKLAV